MIDRIFRIADLPHSLQEAVIERGKSPSDVISLRDALAEYTAWHFGDRAWGYEIADIIDEMATK